MRPIVEESLKAGDLVPRNAAERVAENKVVEELLDGLAHRGFITLSSVRDAIANNQIKFKDIPGPLKAYFSGDPLFRIDRQLAHSLDGVYHRGEIYLWLFQRVSSLLFATSIGRFITLTFLLPLLGSYIIIAGTDHTLFLVTRLAIHWETKDVRFGGFRRRPGQTCLTNEAKEFADAALEQHKQEWHLWHLHPLLNLEFPRASAGSCEGRCRACTAHGEVVVRSSA